MKILLASKSEAHIEQIHEKNRYQKILRYCPFKDHSYPAAFSNITLVLLFHP
jgi:hypothetical protein